jgi:branched-chain amino acid transport system ATP-binding protein
MSAEGPLLAVRGLQAGYAGSQVLFDIELEIRSGEVVTLLGRNGMGKTTTISAIMGIVQPLAGSVTIAGMEVTGLPPHRIARFGLGLVPEGRQIFPTLTVHENLVAAEANWGRLETPWTVHRVLELFPRLQARYHFLGGLLSGGEQQMLAIGRALLTNPQLLILDEATEGLAPQIRTDIWRVIERLKAAGQSILIIDKNIEALIRLSDRHYVVEKGRIAWNGTSAELRDTPEIQHRYLTV